MSANNSPDKADKDDLTTTKNVDKVISSLSSLGVSFENSTEPPSDKEKTSGSIGDDAVKLPAADAAVADTPPAPPVVKQEVDASVAASTSTTTAAAPAKDNRQVMVADTDLSSSSSTEPLGPLVNPNESHFSDVMFTDPQLAIPEPILEAITMDMNLEGTFKIQASTLPYILKGRNIIAQAQAGSGKTIAFAVGMLAALLRNPPAAAGGGKVLGMALAPTRELVNQIIADALVPLASRMHELPGRGPVICEALVKGLTFARGTKSKADIVVGTPGKVGDAITKGYIKCSSIRVFVLDEADAMMENNEHARSLGAETREIRNKLPPECQCMLFSATYTPEIFAAARIMVPKAVTFKLASDDELMMEKIFKVTIDTRVAPGGKIEVLQDIYRKMPMQQSIVFVDRRVAADKVAAMMNAASLEVSVLHSDLDGPQRDETMRRFRDSETRVLITTNILARGVDVPAVAVVINYDLPIQYGGGITGGPDYTSYVHRIGRTGRAEKVGTAISFVANDQDMMIVNQIDSLFSPEKSMMTQWAAKDIDGLCSEIKARERKM